jgi:cell division transport system permease protein
MSEKTPAINKKELRAKTKQNLKVMHQSSKPHRIREEGRVVKYGAIGFTRNVWLSIAAILIMSVTLVILFVTTVSSVVLSDTATTLREKIDIPIYFKPGVEKETLDEMAKAVSSDTNVKSVEVATSEDELAKALEDNKDIALLEDEEMKKIMLENMPATMRIKVYDPENLDTLKRIVTTNDTFAENLSTDPDKAPGYDTNRQEIHTVSSWSNIIKNGGIILGAIFLAISILVIFNTIRMAIFSRREEIYMMKLVGADNHFIRGPFLVEAELCGVISGALSAIISWLGYSIFAPKLSNFGIDMSTVDSVMQSNQIVFVILALVLIGVAIGRMSAQFAIAKYMRQD